MSGPSPASDGPAGHDGARSAGAPQERCTDFRWRVLTVLGLTTLFVALAALLVFSIDILLLVFAGILAGIYLRWLATGVARLVRLPQGVSLALVLVLIILVVGGSLTLLAPIIERQSDTIMQELPKSIHKFRSYLYRFSWGDEVAESTENPEKLITGDKGPDWSEWLTSLVGVFSTTLGVVGGTMFVIVIGIYVAAEADTYFNGFLRLVPVGHRRRAREIMRYLGQTLKWWLIGQSLSMLILGVSVFTILWLLEIPGAIVLALFTAVLTFVPNIGPIIAYVPTALIALTVSPHQLFYVTMLYLAVQSVEGFLITPLVHRKGIAMPPVLILSVQVLLFSLIGFVGVLLAMPLIAIAMVLVKTIYVEGILGDRVEETG